MTTRADAFEGGGPDDRSLLVLGHPGHELRVYGWTARTRPMVCILTDGGGSDGRTRLDHSSTLLDRLGAQAGPVFGELTDRAVYELVRNVDHAPFEHLTERLTQVLIDNHITSVVSDGIEGYNPTHDLCEALTSTAVAIAGRRQSRRIDHRTFALMGDPRLPAGFPRPLEAECRLDDALFRDKKHATLAYACVGGPRLQHEVEETFRTFGEKAFRRERLFRGVGAAELWTEHFKGQRPFYEAYGEKQVAAGKYEFVIRFREHVLPLAERLSALAGSEPVAPGAGSLDARSHH